MRNPPTKILIPREPRAEGASDESLIMSEDKRALLKQRLASGEIRLQPLTFPQRELWEASPVAPSDPANHICCLIFVSGKMDASDGVGALQMVVDRQEALRVSFLPGKEQPVQMIRNEAPPSFRFHELPPEQSSPEAVEQAALQIAAEPFDLLQGPLYRVVLLRITPEEHVLVFTVHHAIADGWTLGVFVQELCLAFIQRVRGIKDPLPAVPLTYTAWGAAERAFWQPSEIQQRIGYWKSHLAGHRRLWTAAEGPATASRVASRFVTHFSSELAASTRELAKKSGATLFSTLLTAFQLAFARWAGTADVLVGTPVANRTKQAAKETMGYFAGIVPIRGQVDAARPFAESLKATHETTINCFANAMPFAELAKELGDKGAPGHNPIFEVRFALQNHPVPDVALPGLSAKLRMRSTGTARCHLACEITEDGEQLEVVWLYRANLFEHAKVEELERLFEETLAAAARPAGVTASSKMAPGLGALTPPLVTATALASLSSI